jgi:hypothetical protein
MALLASFDNTSPFGIPERPGVLCTLYIARSSGGNS